MIFFTTGAISQTVSKEARYKDGEIALRKKLEGTFREECKRNNLNVCLTGVVFAKFTIDSIGNVRHLSFSKAEDTPPVLKNILTTVILSTNGLWLPRIINGKTTESRPFILPLIYSMEAHCNPQELQKANSKITYHEVPNNLETNLLDILNYNNESSANQLDCILLKPLHVFSQN
jgi:hypothetical protein